MDDDLRTMLRSGEVLIAGLVEETNVVLGHLETLSEGEIEQFVRQRQQRVDELELLAANLCASAALRVPGDPEGRRLLENFRSTFHDAVQRILEADGLIRALAGIRKMAIQVELDEIAQGRKAIQGYHSRERRKQSSVNRTA